VTPEGQAEQELSIPLSMLRAHLPCENEQGGPTCSCDALAAFDDTFEEFGLVYLRHLAEVVAAETPR
jgi:hypothetical protein